MTILAGWRARSGLAVLGCVLAASMCVAAPASGATPGSDRTPWPGGTWEPGPARYGISVQSHVPVPVDGGISLNATISYPADPVTGQPADGPFPVLVQFTPYTDEAEPLFVQHGYIGVNVRPRGTGDSPGDYDRTGPVDQRDGVAIVEWAARLDGSDGRVGVYGCSYPGTETLITAAAVGRGSPLKAVVAGCTGLDTYLREAYFRGGMITASGSPRPPADWASPEANESIRQLFQEMADGGPRAYSGSYWDKRGTTEDAARIVHNGVPALLWTSWDDLAVSSALRTYAAMQNTAAGRPVSPAMTAHQKKSGRYQIIVGNGGHGRGLDMSIWLEWFDTFVKGMDTGIDRTSTTMHAFEDRADRWVNLPRYPVVSDYSTWYLGSGTLSRHKVPHQTAPQRLTWGPPENAGGTLVYDSAPIDAGATLAGPMAATIFASSSNTNAQLIATLHDVAPDGTATPISDGVLVGSQRRLDPRKSWTDADGDMIRPFPTQERDEYLVPGRTYRFDIEILPRQWSIAPGHALRLTLTTQPPGPCVPALTSDPCANTRPQLETLPGGEYTIATDRRHPSAVNLPMLPLDHFPTALSTVTPTSNGATIPIDWG